MDRFKDYVTNLKKVNLREIHNVHIVMGNESCDLDSSVSSLALGFLLQSCVYNNSDFAVIPVLNIKSENFPLKTENCYLLRKLGFNLDDFVFRGDLNLKELQEQGMLNVSLVDQHVLSTEDQFLCDAVIQIYDHRPVDNSVCWDSDKVNVKIKQVGSCVTLIAEEIFKSDDALLTDSLVSLIYATIIFDTIALCPEAGKAQELDHNIVEKLEKKFKLVEHRKAVYDELWAAHNDVSDLTPMQLLFKDLKVVEGVPVPGLPMLVRQFLQYPDVYSAMQSFCEQLSVPVVVLMGLHVENGTENANVERDIAFFGEGDSELTCVITRKLKTCDRDSDFDLRLQEEAVDVPGVKYFKQQNIVASRKQVLPLIKEAVVTHRRQCSKN